MRVLVCGGRDFTDAGLLDNTLFALCPLPTTIIHGGARGADQLAASWARSCRIPCWEFPARWGCHGAAAGPIRNAQMLAEGKPDLVVAFPGGKGTADMVKNARAAGVRVIEVETAP